MTPSNNGLAGLLFAVVAVTSQARFNRSISSYDEEEAKMMAALSSVSYCHDEKQILDWSCSVCKDSRTPMAQGKVRIIDAGNQNASRIIVGKLEQQHGCLLAFRGTSNKFNWIRDFQAWKVSPQVFGDCPGCKVHSGFLNIWRNVEDEVFRALREVGCEEDGADDLIYITGHSLGAAMSHIAMFALDAAGFKIAKSYTFEGPRAGNDAFADAYAAAFPKPVFRITRKQDPAVHVPPEWMGYRHVEGEVYYDASGKYTVCRGQEDPSCANRWWNLASMLLLHADDHCASPLVSSGNICFPAGCEDPSSDLVV